MHEGLGNAAQCEGSALQQHRPSLSDDLKQKQTRLEEQLTDVKRMQRILHENPALAEFQEILLRTRNI